MEHIYSAASPPRPVTLTEHANKSDPRVSLSHSNVCACMCVRVCVGTVSATFTPQLRPRVGRGHRTAAHGINGLLPQVTSQRCSASLTSSLMLMLTAGPGDAFRCHHLLCVPAER